MSTSQYSDQKLDCGGRACAKCGDCRDWSWARGGFEKVFKKRDGANCKAASDSHYNFDHDLDGYYHFHNPSNVNGTPFCECKDNQQ